MTTSNDSIKEEIQRRARHRAEAVEQELITKDVVTFVETDGGKTVYTVPSWRRHPVRRFKIFRLRRRARKRVKG